MASKLSDSKGFYIAFSILISIALWVYVVGVVNPTGTSTVHRIPIEIQGEDVLERRGLMVSDLSRETISLELSGKRISLGSLNEENILITLDVSAITEVGEFPIKCRVTLPSTLTSGSVSVGEKNDLTITVTVVKQASKPIEVRGNFTGSAAEGYQVDTFVISPSTVTITGREDHVNQVAYAVVNVDQANLSETFTGELGFALMDATGHPLEDLDLTCNVDTVYVSLPVVKVQEIDLAVTILEGGGATRGDIICDIEPKSIIISGEEEDLASWKEINLGTIDLSKILNTETYTFDILLPSELTNESGITQATVTVKVEGLATKVLETNSIDIINPPDGFTVTRVTQSLPVVIRGTEEELNLVFEHQLRVVADLKDQTLSAGQFRVPAKVYLDGGSGAGVVGDYSISISLSQ